MKLARIISLLCMVIFVSSLALPEGFGQKAENVKPIEKSDSSGEKKSPQQQIEKSETSEAQNNVVAAINQNTDKNTQNERYRIGYQDTIEVSVFRHPELLQNTILNPDGTINLPRIDVPVMAVCKTEGELKNNITALYKTYLRDPFVTVRVVNQMSQGFAVIGAVQKPGNFYLNRRVRLLELLSLAGGQDVEFAGGKIQVARIGNVTGCKGTTDVTSEKDDIEFLSFRLRDVLEGKQNPWLHPGDIVSVMQAEEAYVIGNVNKPTKISLREPVTLTMALAQAEGTDKNAEKGKVIIQRQEPGSAIKTELAFNLKDIRDKKIPDPFLQANDIVSVGTDKIKSLSNGLLKIVTGALPNAVYRIP